MEIHFSFHATTSFDMDPPTSWEELFGVPASILRNWSSAWQATNVHDYQRAFEYVVPLKIARDISVGVRQHTKGLTTLGGSPITMPNEVEPYKTSKLDMAKQFLGFQPLEVMKLRDVHGAIQDVETTQRNKQNEFVTRYVNSMRIGDEKELSRIIDEVVAWNEKWISKGMPQLAVDLTGGVKARMRPSRPAKRMRGKALEMEETWMK